MTQTHRVTVDVVSLPGLQGQVVVNAVCGREEVSRPFRYQVDLTADAIDPDRARGGQASFLLEDSLGQVRHLSGVVQRIETLASDGTRNRFRLHLVPLAFMLSHRHGFRIFQDLSVPEIVRKVFKDAGMKEGSLQVRLRASYGPRQLCVQYDESEWDFVCRLLEEEGIWFGFDQTADGHTMFLSDSSSKADPADPDALPYRHDADLHGEAVRAWGFTDRARTSIKKAGVDGYDFLRPSVDLFTDSEPKEGEGFWSRHRQPFVSPSDGKRLAQVRLEELRRQRQTCRLATNALPVQAGRKNELEDHEAAGPWFVAALSLSVQLEEELEGGPLCQAGPVSARLDLELFPGDREFRPARLTPRPVIAGLQSACVVGPPGEEIHCDEHGRVKLRFPWDSEATPSERASCWIRVIQPQTTGALMIPRVGWEVLVEFLNGDPDHPVCQGRVYNPRCPPPCDLPAEKTVTAHRSFSSPGGQGVNELRFEDSPGAQELSLHAERDLHVTAAHDHRSDAKNAASVSVTGVRKVTVGARAANKETVQIGGNESHQVEGNQQVSAGSRTVKVAHDASEQVKGKLDITVSANDSVLVGSPLAALGKAAVNMAKEAAVNAAQQAGNQLQARALGPLQAPLLALQSGASQASALKAPGFKNPLVPAGKEMSGAAKAVGDAMQSLQGMSLGSIAAQGMADALGVGGAPGTATAAKVSAVAAPAASAAPAKGTGAWNVTVQGNTTEKIQGQALLVTAMGMSLQVGGNSKEQVGGARALVVATGGSTEMTKGNCTEMVGGLTMRKIKAGMTVQAGAAAATTAVVSQKIKTGKGYSISATLGAAIGTRKLQLKAQQEIVLTCGLSKVVISSSGIELHGTKVQLEGKKVKCSQPTIMADPT